MLAADSETCAAAASALARAVLGLVQLHGITAIGEVLLTDGVVWRQALVHVEVVARLSERRIGLENLGARGCHRGLSRDELWLEITAVDAKQRLSLFRAVAHFDKKLGQHAADRGTDGNIAGTRFDHAGAGDVALKGRHGRLYDRLRDGRRHIAAGNERDAGEKAAQRQRRNEVAFSDHI
jgi:hypothetical protein